ncbi:hypothetical protein MLD38_026894 [Melastoma candidum]|uniref:Uncharacterized protein n=1 Tax=Melastoma candidum TaxID=119954 RepID=A0ACB9NZZ8_9MYRT|nr:hypothetical protein MLD38_026894 [Melastoma candidum]
MSKDGAGRQPVDDLDELLDSALDGFQSLGLSSSSAATSARSRDGGEAKRDLAPLGSGVQGLGMGLPDLRSKKLKVKQKPLKETDHVAEALEKLRQQTRETVRGMENVTGGDDPANNAMLEDWLKQFEEIAEGPQDVESMVQTMMQQLLSKEILHEPMKEIGEKYPKWLEEHESTLSKEEYERYSHQYELIKELNQVYESEPDNFAKIVDLMQKMQDCGQPPNDIVRDLAPDFDLSTLGQISPEMLESQPNCCLM